MAKRQTVTITHRITDNSVTTTLRMPGKPPMTKTWKQLQDGSFMLDTCNTWEDEDLPCDISDAAERCPHGIVGLLRDRNLPAPPDRSEPPHPQAKP